MTHPIRRVVTGARREGPRGVISDGPALSVHANKLEPDWFSVDIWRARDAGQDRCKPPSAGPGWAGPRSWGVWDRCSGR